MSDKQNCNNKSFSEERSLGLIVFGSIPSTIFWSLRDLRSSLLLCQAKMMTFLVDLMGIKRERFLVKKISKISSQIPNGDRKFRITHARWLTSPKYVENRYICSIYIHIHTHIHTHVNINDELKKIVIEQTEPE